MVKITDYKRRTSNEGRDFFALVLHGGVELIKSANGNSYLTNKRASMPTTFDEATCKALIGTELSGTIEKVSCSPYEYTIQETGESITLSHRYEYVDKVETTAVDFTKIIQPSANGIHKPATA